jgi:hypothetical protein
MGGGSYNSFLPDFRSPLPMSCAETNKRAGRPRRMLALAPPEHRYRDVDRKRLPRRHGVWVRFFLGLKRQTFAIADPAASRTREMKTGDG